MKVVNFVEVKVYRHSILCGACDDVSTVETVVIEHTWTYQTRAPYYTTMVYFLDLLMETLSAECCRFSFSQATAVDVKVSEE